MIMMFRHFVKFVGVRDINVGLLFEGGFEVIGLEVLFIRGALSEWAVIVDKVLRLVKGSSPWGCRQVILIVFSNSTVIFYFLINDTVRIGRPVRTAVTPAE